MPYQMAPPEDTQGDRNQPMPGSDTDTTTYDFTLIPAEDRQELYREAYTQDIPLHLMRRPEAADTHPQFSREIVEAYFRYTTFNVQVYANYDAAAGKFYKDGRFEDCGKPILSPRQIQELKARNGHQQMLYNVRYDVGTAFRTLARITIEVRPTGLKVGPAVDTFIANVSGHAHMEFFDWLKDLCDLIKQVDITSGKDGFMLADVFRLATVFKREPSEAEERRMKWGSTGGMWLSTNNGD